MEKGVGIRTVKSIVTVINLLKYGQMEAGIGSKTANSIATTINLPLYGQVVTSCGSRMANGDQPAVILTNGTREWWINGVRQPDR
jgi:hypothetical protein